MAALIQPRQRGHSLIEVLVATMVVGIGALGVAKLHMLSSQNNRIALEHSLATLLADDMLERIRANPAGVYAVALGTPPQSFANCVAGTCSPAELAAFDVAVWKCSLGNWQSETACASARGVGALPSNRRRAGLPAGDGSVASNGAGGVTVTVAWGASRVAIDGAP